MRRRAACSSASSAARVCFVVRDRRGDELDELVQPILSPDGQHSADRREDAHLTPQLAVDEDRTGNARSETSCASCVADRSPQARIVVDSRGSTGLEDLRGEAAGISRHDDSNVEKRVSTLEIGVVLSAESENAPVGLEALDQHA